MKRNIRLTIEYDGSRYQGWQRLGGDSNANTIQGKLESVVTLENEKWVMGSDFLTKIGHEA